jgi:hypothetical protein
MIRSFLRALWAMRSGDAKLTVYQGRLRVCYACSEVRIRERGVYCGACGCPEWALSDLRTKARIRSISCPLEKW